MHNPPRDEYQSGARRFRSVLLATLLCVCAASDAAVPERLPALHADANATTVSGISSGGFMAVQFHVAHSASIKGAAIVAGGPYYCAQNNVWAARYNCLQPGPLTPLPAVALLKAETEQLARIGQIDATSHLKSARVWLFWGSEDAVVKQPVMDALQRFYGEYVPADSTVFVRGVKAGHGMVTQDYGGSCAATAAPYINDCDFDAAGKLLAHLYGPLQPAIDHPSGRLLAFDQKEFAGGDAKAISLADTAYAYIPKECDAAHCRVHVAFHGCRQNADTIKLAYVEHAGYNRWADGNRIIVLYPQTIARGLTSGLPLNPEGCWDWWGYSGALYHTKEGPQIRAVQAMIERLAQP